MGVTVARFRYQENTKWGVVKGNHIHPLKGDYDTLPAFLEFFLKDETTTLQVESALFDSVPIAIDQVEFLSPVTRSARILCQGANYGSHRKEGGLTEGRPPFNLIFRKEDSALLVPNKDIKCPPHVKLLDYEIELGLVIGKEITGPIAFETESNLHKYVTGLVITNDISARETQLLEGQWYKGKSYRTFCPVGPYLYLLDKDEMDMVNDLEIRLWVNRELRQSANTRELLYKPVETMTELSETIDLSPGDLVLTGTTGGVSLKVSPELKEEVLLSNLPYAEKYDKFVESQLSNGYLEEGDVVRLEIKSSDGQIDLGVLENRVKS